MDHKLAPSIHPRLRTSLRLLLSSMIFFSIMRIVFLFLFKPNNESILASHLAKSFYLGFKFDLRLALGVLLPFFLLSSFSFFNPFPLQQGNYAKLRARRQAWSLFYTAVATCLLLFYLLDVGYYAYLYGRLNATAISFFETPLISASMVIQSYPVGWGLLGVVLFSSFSYWVMRRFVFSLNEEKSYQLTTKSRYIQVTLASVLMLSAAYGKFSYYPLRWSEAFFSDNNFVSSLALNPVHYFFDTISNRRPNFDIAQLKKYYPAVSKYLKVENPTPEKPNFLRSIELNPLVANSQPNIVVIVMESFASYKTGVQGHPLNPTPHFDQLANNGWLFENFFVPSEATARSMFCIATGVPDVGVGRTSSRNPLIVNQNTLINAFSGYEKYYFLGGSANWGNIRGVFDYNIEGVHIIEEGMFDTPRTDVWGISDLHLLEEAHVRFDKQDKPFIAVIQTAGFHRPYTIPEDNRDFEVKTLSEVELKKYGFVSTDEYNSLRFSDHALGNFMSLAKTSPYYNNTIFVITGDHGLPDYGAEHLAKGYKKFGISRWHVPLVFHAPQLLSGSKRIKTITTEPDIMPTLAGITGHSFPNTALGRNVLALKPTDAQYAFTYVYYKSPPKIGLIDQEFYVTGLPGKPTGLYKYQSEDSDKDWSKELPEKYLEMSELMTGLYETSRFMLYNNPSTLRKKQ